MEIYNILSKYNLNRLVLYSLFDQTSLNEEYILKDEYNLDGTFTYRLFNKMLLEVQKRNPDAGMTDLIINKDAKIAPDALYQPRGVSVWKVNSDLAQLYREYTLDKNYKGDICIGLDKGDIDNLIVVVGKF